MLMSASMHSCSLMSRVGRLWLPGVLAWGLATAWLLPRADDPLRLALLVPIALLCLGSPAVSLGRAWLQAGLAGLPVLAAVLMPPFDARRAWLVTLLGSPLNWTARADSPALGQSCSAVPLR